MEELNCETAFTIPVFGGIPVAESVVVTWIIMAVLLLGSIILVRNLKAVSYTHLDVYKRQMYRRAGRRLKKREKYCGARCGDTGTDADGA